MSRSEFPLVKTHSFTIDNYKYYSSGIFYSDTVQIFLTHDGKIGSLILYSYKFGAYDCQNLLGKRCLEFKALGRCLIEKYKDMVSIKSPLETELYLLLCLNLHEISESSSKIILKELETFYFNQTPN